MLLAATQAALFLLGEPAGSQEPSKTGQKHLLDSGPMVGWNTESTVVLWARTTKPCDMEIRYWPESAPGSTRTSKSVRTSTKDDLCAHIRLVGLPFGTRFGYEILLNHTPVRVPQRLTFQTQPHWRYRTSPPDLTIALGSCSYVNDPTVDRPGKPYGGNPAIFASIAEKRPDVMLWLGDNVYYRAPDWSEESGMRRRYAHDRRLPELAAILGASHHLSIWDDHDYAQNDSDRSFALKDASLRTFRLYWANGRYGTPETKGIFGRFSWGDVEFFLLDNRYHRTPNDAPSTADKVMFGKPQMKWLLDSITSSKATFKVIAGGNQLLNPIVNYEGWGSCKHERNSFLKAISERGIRGIFFLSGDRHHTELIRIQRKGTYPLYDYTSSPLLSSTNTRLGNESENPSRVPGTLVNQTRNFGLLRFLGKGKERRVILSAHDEAGSALWQHKILAEDLK